MANMGAHEKESDLAVWTLEMVELACFLRFIVNNNNNKNKRLLACIVFANRMIWMKSSD